MSDKKIVIAHHSFVQRLDTLAEQALGDPVFFASCVACGSMASTFSEEDANEWAAAHDEDAPVNTLFAGLKPGYTRRLVRDDDGRLVLDPVDVPPLSASDRTEKP